MSIVLQVFGHKPKYRTNFQIKFLPDDGARGKVWGMPKLLQFILRGT